MTVAIALLITTLVIVIALLTATSTATLARTDGATYPTALTRAATTFAAVITLAAVTTATAALLTQIPESQADGPRPRHSSPTAIPPNPGKVVRSCVRRWLPQVQRGGHRQQPAAAAGRARRCSGRRASSGRTSPMARVMVERSTPNQQASTS